MHTPFFALGGVQAVAAPRHPAHCGYVNGQDRHRREAAGTQKIQNASDVAGMAAIADMNRRGGGGAGGEGRGRVDLMTIRTTETSLCVSSQKGIQSNWRCASKQM